MFNPICLRVETLVKKQLEAVGFGGPKKERMCAVLLVGGFGESQYLFDKLEIEMFAMGVKLLKNANPYVLGILVVFMRADLDSDGLLYVVAQLYGGLNAVPPIHSQ